MCSEKAYVYWPIIKRGAVLTGLKMEIFDMLAYLTYDLYHKTYSSSDHDFSKGDAYSSEFLVT